MKTWRHRPRLDHIRELPGRQLWPPTADSQVRPILPGIATSSTPVKTTHYRRALPRDRETTRRSSVFVANGDGTLTLRSNPWSGRETFRSMSLGLRSVTALKRLTTARHLPCQRALGYLCRKLQPRCFGDANIESTAKGRAAACPLHS
jgi:hypothetical protein